MTWNKMRIDGNYYDVTLLSLKRRADILDKYANRTEDGELHREVIGTYYNYTMELRSDTIDGYAKVFEVLSNPVPYHTIELPTDHIQFDAYFSSIEDELVRLEGYNKPVWHKLTCRLTAVRPRKYGDGTRT